MAAALATALGCTTTKVLHPELEHARGVGGARVLLLPLDIELAELTTGGLTAPRADWTAAARDHLTRALEGHIQGPGTQTLRGDPSLLAVSSPHLQLFKLHEAVGQSILAYQIPQSGQQLPTLTDRFDWTLGSDVRALAADTHANYALFVFVRDSYATGGRKALRAGSLATCAASLGIFCAPVSTGVQLAFASLVDLESGDIVWFNRLVSETGDLREAEPADHSAERLLKDFPL
jgi:hypothetical protein